MNCFEPQIMKRTVENWLAHGSKLDWAMLYTRLFLGGSVILHNVCKIGNYNEIIDSYPSLLYISNAATFLLVLLAEIVMALLLMIGFRVRLAAGLLAGMAFVALIHTLPAENPERLERLFVTCGMMLAPAIGGGGFFSVDALRVSDFSTREEQ